MTISSGMAMRASAFVFEGVDVGRGFDLGVADDSEWKSRSTMAEEIYSTVPKPLLKLRAAMSRCSSSSGIGSPV